MLNDLAHCPGLMVDWRLMQHVVAVESSFNPHAIGVVGTPLSRQPTRLEEAVELAGQLRRQGRNYSLGLAQVNVHNLAAQGLHSHEKAFEPCPNVVAGSRILAACHQRYGSWEKALSCYYAGNAQTGFEHGYVQKVVKRVLEHIAGTGPSVDDLPPVSGAVQRRRLLPTQTTTAGTGTTRVDDATATDISRVF